MYNGHRFIDSDAHILEPADMFQKYLEPKFRWARDTSRMG